MLKSSALVSLWRLHQGTLSFLVWTCCWPWILHDLSSHCTEAHPQGQALQTAMRQKLGLSAALYWPWEFLTKFSNFIFTRVILSGAVKTFTVFFSTILMEVFNHGGKVKINNELIHLIHVSSFLLILKKNSPCTLKILANIFPTSCAFSLQRRAGFQSENTYLQIYV